MQQLGHLDRSCLYRLLDAIQDAERATFDVRKRTLASIKSHNLFLEESKRQLESALEESQRQTRELQNELVTTRNSLIRAEKQRDQAERKTWEMSGEFDGLSAEDPIGGEMLPRANIVKRVRS